MRNITKKYRFLIVVSIINSLLILLDPTVGAKSLHISLDNLRGMIAVIPPIFLLIGLFDVWVPKETIIKLMGDKSGLLGVSLAFALGSFSAGPLYAAFPGAEVLLDKGSKFSNTMIFIGAWSTTKIPMLLFEASSMGWQFMLCRLIINLLGILMIAYLIEKMITDHEKALICEKGLSL
jgi:uncharacterized membrane protein YraQ (UPF0718 family)